MDWASTAESCSEPCTSTASGTGPFVAAGITSRPRNVSGPLLNCVSSTCRGIFVAMPSGPPCRWNRMRPFAQGSNFTLATMGPSLRQPSIAVNSVGIGRLEAAAAAIDEAIAQAVIGSRQRRDFAIIELPGAALAGEVRRRRRRRVFATSRNQQRGEQAGTSGDPHGGVIERQHGGSLIHRIGSRLSMIVTHTPCQKSARLTAVMRRCSVGMRP